MESLASFFQENEQKSNALLKKAFVYCLGVLVILIAACLVGLLPDIDTHTVVIICLIDTAIVIILLAVLKRWNNRGFIKYLFISVLCILTFSIAIIPNMRVYLSFLIPPLLSIFFVNERFTITTCIFSGLTYVLAIGARCLFEADDTFMTMSRLRYFFAYGFGGLVEHAIYSFILFYLTRTTRSLLMHSYLRKKRLNQIHNVILEGFANIVESKDKSTAEHISRTSRYVQIICEKLQERGMYPDTVNDTTIPVMIRAAPFHDLGKISISDDILNKPSELDGPEWHAMHHHPADGAQFILKNFVVLDDDLFTKTASEMALCHHEHVDGTGYPFKLIADEIPISARIMATADIFDALVSKRAYKLPYSIDDAYVELQKLSGTTLDPELVDCMVASRDKVEQVLKECCS
ncbi:MAG: HD domain-containing protein [Treponema sp.]|nr:HD domain-containing protein [Candidatus Treponema caballi]